MLIEIILLILTVIILLAFLELKKIRIQLQKNTETQTALSYIEDDPLLYEKAKDTVIKNNSASASLLQRQLKIGYARAAYLLDKLVEDGIVGPARGAEPRKILKKDN